ncbi:chorismate-binding protein [Microlunatus flavus]|uniref:Para-aminobenzoate synthetase / 4-amino-4-deoxychorismate lyase n=1 Tax=Microlunatus flavus TaxID=1036181 RepID=A0A1H9GYC1_9ACTN|nr:chorismate-binding protein [Microlunatus flavus]SEQ55045.1 para-aminobenzoate synthetase / 4-amino-4-deoxychorismate lyase [Microlunatus flavus]
MVRVDFLPGEARAGTGTLRFGEPARTVVATSLEAVVPALREVDEASAAGWWAVGFVTYDAAPAFDPAFAVPGRRAEGAAALPLVWFGLHRAPLDLPADGAASAVPGGWRAAVERDAYAAAFDQVQAAVRRGDTYQTNLTLPLTASWDDGAADPGRYAQLLTAQGPCFGAYLDLGRHHVLSVSPELFFARRGSTVTTRPMKGTARRGRSSAEDAGRLAALLGSEKERAENVMITDLLRNDLGRVAVPGTVDVPALCVPERYPTVWQLTSTVTAEVPPRTGLGEVFAALFPCGSVTGAPKVSTMRLIERLEPHPRGLYCGAVGVVAPGGDATFSVGIRTVVADTLTRTAVYGVGSGVTVDSTAAGEHDELLAKAAVLTAPPRPAFDLLETLRLEEGAWWALEEHLDRLAASAAWFGRPDPAPAARAALAEVVRTHPTGRWRVRLTVDEPGRAATTVVALPANPDVPLSLVLAEAPVDAQDVFLAHKTTWREAYAPHRAHAAARGADDALLWNRDGQVTETTIGSVVLHDAGGWWTPPVSCGLLPGVERGLALADGRLRERVLTVAEVTAALGAGAELWFLNSVRGWRRAVLLD